jgi:DNA damage-binding protein 1
MSKDFDNTLVLSFVQQTRILSLNGDEVSETEIAGFQTDCQSFYCGNVSRNEVVQVSSVSVRLIDTDTSFLIW